MSKDLKSKVFPLSHEKTDWNTCRKEWEGKYYSYGPTSCVCGVGIMEQYMIHNSITGEELIVGNVCMQQFDDKLIEWAKAEKSMHKAYTVTGAFQKNSFGKNNFKIRKNSKLSKLLTTLQNKGYKVPMYGYKYIYISVTENITRQVMEDYKLNLQLIEYDKPTKGVILKSIPLVSKKRKADEME